ncbi:GNAT family N-acetyltransferase [Azospirillum halopraeferens]|uniref:bifunctional acetate--CoA ligase family protein/GNAT family N-acetyltransferase n=1 Tax=Azospirillum halopraeferens TaxID=34010 RepID=UPI0004126F02|nr:GNAT family N-acetyltransferase [Azospirillum halopraeferens]
MSVRELQALFRPGGLVVAGAPDDPLVRAVRRNLAPADGRLVVAVERLDELTALPELCVLVAAPDRLPGLLAEAGRRGARAVILAGGHAPDAAACAALRTAARGAGVRVVGPASSGIAVPARRLIAGAFHRPPPAGSVALVAQSATLAGAVVDWAIRRDAGFSHVAVLGDQADVGFADVIDYLAGQAECRSILLAIDRLTDARRFLSAARAAARLKPVIVLRTGRHEDGDGVTPDAVFDAAFRRSGLLRVRTLETLFDALGTLASGVPIRGDRLAIVANGRGIGRLAADALGDQVYAGGIGRLAQPAGLSNPLDLDEGADGAAYAGALTRLAGDPGVDAVLLLHAPTALTGAGDVARGIAAVLPEVRTPVLTSWLGERDGERAASDLAHHHVPVYETPDRAVRAFLHRVRQRRNLDLLTETPPSVPDAPPADDAAARAALAAQDAVRLLGAYGVTVGGPPPPGVELTLRAAVDPLFGPVLWAGTVAVLPPLNPALARETLLRVPALRAAAEEERGAAVDAAALLLVRLSQLVLERESVADLVLAPVRIGPCGVWVGGASLRRLPPGAVRMPPAIRPYPRELEAPLALADGRRFLVRPLVPEDEPALRGLFARLTADEIRLRFFAPKAELSHATAARMTQLDYDREMGLAVAEPGPPGAAALHGVVHLSVDADGERGEFAIMVAHDAGGLGFGPVLMRRILDHARARGVKEVFGEVLMENRAMLRLCQALGFARRCLPEDPGVVHVTRAP